MREFSSVCTLKPPAESPVGQAGAFGAVWKFLMPYSTKPPGDDDITAGAEAKAAECLAYIADLLAELKGIAERTGHGRLASALALAHAEARHQLEQQRTH